MFRMKVVCLSVFLAIWFSTLVENYAHGQTTALSSVEETLAHPVQPPVVTAFQLQQYLFARVPSLPSPATADQWTAEEKRLRHHILDDVAFHGWPREWVESAPRFKQVGVIETGDGYRIRKFRYEIVPGFMSTALLYEPNKITGRAPAILNLIGHESEGINVEYEQKRCINFAKRGIVALNLGWMGFGELSQPENNHDYAADLDLVGSNAFGLFYLAMRRGLDYLAMLPEVDPARLGVTGLSGGGWQTVMLGALDKRVAVSVEVAGIGSRESNLTHPEDTYEVEEDAPDLMQGEAYPEFVAMRAPWSTLLIHNAVDSCCFRAPLVKPGIYDKIKPFFKLYGKPDNLAWHENFNPGVHNYQLDNRQQAYRFFTEHFHMPVAEQENFSDDEIRTPQQLAIGVPANNLTIVSLAKQLASAIHREPIPAGEAQRIAWAASQRKILKSVVRYTPVSTLRALRMDNSVGYNFQTLSYRFDYSNGLSATGIWFKENAATENQPVAIVLNDNGYKAAAEAVFERVARGEQVLAFDPIFIGSAAPGPDVTAVSAWMVMVDSTGDRCLGLEAAQLVATANWLRSTTGQSRIRLETNGIRTQVIALVAAAIDPGAFSDVVSRNAMKSLVYLIDKPVPFRSATELFCLDLYKDFDIDSLRTIASPVKATQISFVP
ncbi:MAG: alpha/beta hydrolase family protein [Acidobacteriaceae bacterium]